MTLLQLWLVSPAAVAIEQRHMPVEQGGGSGERLRRRQSQAWSSGSATAGGSATDDVRHLFCRPQAVRRAAQQRELTTPRINPATSTLTASVATGIVLRAAIASPPAVCAQRSGPLTPAPLSRPSGV